MAVIERALTEVLERRLRSRPNLLQVVVGPRQVGKTTSVRQVLSRWDGPAHYATADLPAPPDAVWLEAQWSAARALAGRRAGLLVVDEIQKVSRWSEVVKRLVDEDRQQRSPLRVVVLGSAALLVQQGLSESLAGRFELHHAPHWSLQECRQAFAWGLEEWLFRGGYPGAARLARTHERWADYVRTSLIETALSRDVLQMTRISKPALLRQLFQLATQAPAQILSFNKMLGQLQDAGNTVTLAHYLKLLEAAFLVSGLPRFAPGHLPARASSPKLVVWDNALVTALGGRNFRQTRSDTELWGRLVENAVGASVLAASGTGRATVHYFREGEAEVDYVVTSGERVLGIEVKSGRARSPRGLSAFQARHPGAKVLVVGAGGVPLDVFFETPLEVWLR